MASIYNFITMIYRMPFIHISQKNHDLNISALERRRLQNIEENKRFLSHAARIFKGVNTCINCYKECCMS